MTDICQTFSLYCSGGARQGATSAHRSEGYDADMVNFIVRRMGMARRCLIKIFPCDAVASDDTASTAITEDPVSDQALIHACLLQDHHCYAQLVKRYEAAAARILWQFTRDPGVLEELLQDTFVEAYFSLRRFRADAPFFPWLRTIATRVGYRHWRRLRREQDRRALLEQWRREAGARRMSAAPSDTAEFMFQTLQLLPPKDRLVLTLQYFDECSVDEIARRTGWTHAMVKVRAFRARKRLRAILMRLEHDNHE